MKSRLLIVLISLVLAAAATVGTAVYIAKLRASVVEGQKLVEVLVADSPAPAGSSVAELFATGGVRKAQVPRQYVAEAALSSIDDHKDRVLATELARGEQLTETKLREVNATGMAHKVPEGHVAMSIAVDEVTAVGGKLQPGDRIDIIATLSPGPEDADVSKTLLQNVQVLATSDAGTGDPSDATVKAQSGASKKTVTLAVTLPQAEKLVFASEKGHTWLCLRRTGNEKFVPVEGRTVKTVFK